MKRIFTSAVFVLILFCSVLTLSGCWVLLGAAAGAGGYAWVSGVLQSEFEVSNEKLAAATEKGLKRLALPIKEKSVDHLTAKFKSELADGNDVTIDINAITEKSARIKIRVGLLGDQKQSEMIMDSIKKYL